MRTAVLGALIGAGLAIVAVAATPESSALPGQRSGRQAAAGPERGLIALSATVDDRYQLVTVVDPGLRAISVYHVELTTGEIKLCCVRDIRWDLQMEHYNGKGLLPPEIRSMLQTP
jgi:hypothetical protein